MTDAKTPNVEKGQIWRCNDSRFDVSRYLEVLRVEGAYAYCRSFVREFGGDRTLRKETRIKLSRFKPTSTGYVRVKDWPR